MHNGKAALMDWMEEGALSHRVMRSIHNLEWTGAAIAFVVMEDAREVFKTYIRRHYMRSFVFVLDSGACCRAQV